jgi:uroporphyrinogen-III synthase
MRLLLTRDVADSARTRALLEAAGHDVLVSPVIEFLARCTPWPRRPPHGIIATSARAFMALHREGPPEEARATIPLYVVGERTEAEARRHGFAGPMTRVEAAASLAAILLAERKAMRLVYLAGYDRKEHLETVLAASRHRLVVLETYEARAATSLTPEAIAALGGGMIDAVLHYSRRSAAIFVTLAEAAGLDTTKLVHLCLSRDVATTFARHEDVRVSDVPTDEGLRALLDRF